MQSAKIVKTEKLTGLFEVLTIVVPISLYLLIRLRSTTEPGDDAYMTLRFVTNLIAGNGYVYNPGEPVLGTTALYPLLLALVCKIFGTDPISTGRYFLLPFEVGNLALIWFFGRKVDGQPLVGMVAAILFGTSQYLLYSTLIYMEAPLFVFLILASCAAYALSASSTWRALGWIFAGLAFICRPEGGLLFPVLFCSYLLSRKKLKLADGFWSALIVVPWIIWTIWQFGGPIPTSMLAKRLAYLPYPNQSIAWLFEQIGMLFNISGSSAQPGSARVAFNLILLIYGAMSIVVSAPALFPLLLFALTYWVFYALANPFIFPWYVVPLDAPFYLAVTVAVYRLTSLCSAFLFPRSNLSRNVLFLLIFIPMTVLRLAGFNGKVCQIAGENSECRTASLAFPLPDINPRGGLVFEREGWYRQVANDLALQVTPSTTILTSEFGVIGYYLPAHMISSLGHVNPEVLPFLPAPLAQTDYPSINHAISIELVQKLLPEYVISPEIFIRKSLLTSEWFKQNYETVKIYPFGVYNYGQLYVFKHQTVKTDLPKL